MSQRIRVLVTGASAGIGLELVKRLASSDYLVYGCARNIQAIQDLPIEKKDNLRAVKCDVTNEDDVKSMFSKINEEVGGIEICVNNAGMAKDESLLDGSPEGWRTMYEVNVIGVCLVTQHAVKSMQASGSESCIILNINSVLGLPTVKYSRPIRSFYSGTKHALAGITSALRGELSLKGLSNKIRVMQIFPGMVETEFMYRSSGEEAANAAYGSTKVLETNDVVESIIHALRSPKHCTITDQVIWPSSHLDALR